MAIAGHLLMSTAVSGTLSGTSEVEFATVEADGKRLVDAENDYEVNLKAELEIMALHEKIDSIRQKQLEQLLLLQQNQLDMIKKMIEDAGLKTSSS